MNREIKFRAWDNVNSRMFHFGKFIWHDEYNLCYMDGRLDVPSEDNINWMQFTGHQLNGIDIYESDIVRVEENEDGIDPKDGMTWYVVTWIKEWCMFALLRVEDEYKQYMDKGIEELDTSMFWTFPLDLEDIGSSKHFLCGNIFEHPHLLNHNG